MNERKLAEGYWWCSLGGSNHKGGYGRAIVGHGKIWFDDEAPAECFASAVRWFLPSDTLGDEAVLIRLDGERQAFHVYSDGHSRPDRCDLCLAELPGLHEISAAEAQRLIKQAKGPLPGEWQGEHEYAGEFCDPSKATKGTFFITAHGSITVIDCAIIDYRIDSGNRFILRWKPEPAKTTPSAADPLREAQAEIARLKEEVATAHRGWSAAEAEVSQLTKDLAAARKPLVLDRETVQVIADKANDAYMESVERDEDRWRAFAASAACLVLMLDRQAQAKAAETKCEVPPGGTV